MPDHSASSSNLFSRIGTRNLVIGGVVILAAVGIALGLILSGGSTPTATPPTSSSTTSTTHPALASNLCPLTGAPPPGGGPVPQRPAVLVKIGNEPFTEARPQAGLNEADIVFDTPAEGFIMRYMAAFQCFSASSIGPTRSVRWVDYHLARMFENPVLAFAGGINPNVDAVLGDKWIHPADLIGAQANAAQRISSRSGDDSLFTSTAELWGLYPKAKTPPPPVFEYSSTLPSTAATTATAQLDFSYGTYGVWTWNASANNWVHSYAGQGSDTDVNTGTQVTTSNIVVMIVAYKIGPYSEHGGPGDGDIESETVGEGPGYVLRNGKRVAVTWHRKDLLAGMTFTDSKGDAVALTPGRTWVEIMPNTIANIPGKISFTA